MLAARCSNPFINVVVAKPINSQRIASIFDTNTLPTTISTQAMQFRRKNWAGVSSTPATLETQAGKPSPAQYSSAMWAR